MKIFSFLRRFLPLLFLAIGGRLCADSNAPVFYSLTVAPSIDVAATAPYFHGQLDWSAVDETGTTVGVTQAVIGGSNTTKTMSYTGSTWNGGNFVPYKDYTMNVTLLLGTTGHIGVTLTSSQTGVVFINGVQQSSIDISYPGTSGPQWMVFPVKIRVALSSNFMADLEPSYLAAGAATSFAADKPVWYLGLGRMRNGDPAGVVGFRQQTLLPPGGTTAPYVCTTPSLYYASYYPDIDDEVDLVTVSGSLKQVLSREVLVNITFISLSSYRLDVYSRRDNAVAQSAPGVLCTFTGSPFVVYVVSQVTNGVDITRTEDAIIWDTSLVNSGSTWTLTDWHVPSTLTSALTTTYSSATAATVNQTGPASNLSSMVPGYTDTAFSWTKTLTTNGTGQYVISNTTYGANETTPLSTSYAYYASSNATTGSYINMLQSVKNSDGTWGAYAYYVGSGPNDTTIADGKIKTFYHPYLDTVGTPLAPLATTSAVDQYTYSYVQKGLQVSPPLAATSSAWLPASMKSYAPDGTLLKQSTWTYNNNLYTAAVNGLSIWSATEKDFSDSTNGLTTVSKFYVQGSANSPSYMDDKPYSVTFPNGSKDSYGYIKGTWNSATLSFSANNTGADRLVLCFHGRVTGGISPVTVSSWINNGITAQLDSLSMEPNRSTVSENVVDAYGRSVFTGSDVFVSAGTIARVSGSSAVFDAHCRLTNVVDVMRSVTGNLYQSQFVYSSQLLTSETAPDGFATSHVYDGLLRQTKKISGVGGATNYPATTINTIYDEANRPVSTYAFVTGLTNYYYDTAGRMTKLSSPAPTSGTYLSTLYTYSTVNSTTVTSPTGATAMATTYLDGRVKAVSGTARKPSYASYVANATGMSVTTTNTASTDQSQGWSTTQFDLLGRGVSQTGPTYGWTGTNSNVLKASSSYDNTSGVLTSQSSTYVASGGLLAPVHLYVYDGAGRLTQDGLDLDGTGTLTAASNDRIVIHDSYFGQDTLGWRQISTTSTYPTLGSATITQLSLVATRLTGFNGGALGTFGIVAGDVSTTDTNGQTANQIESISPSLIRHHVVTTLPGTSNTAYTETINGYSSQSQSTSGTLTEQEYDSHGRIATRRSRWNGASFDAADTLAYYIDTAFISSQTVNGFTTSFSYAWSPATTSRTVTTTDALGNASYTLYNAMDLPSHIGGAASAPTQYGYDSLGRVTSQTTWRNGPYTEANWPISGGDTTSFTIESATGLTTSKIFPDAVHNHVDYTYTSLGQPLTRKWARGTIAMYAYFDGSTTTAADVSHRTQELRSISYSDTTSPVSYLYNRSGVPASVTDVTGQRTFTYDPAQPMRVTSENLTAYYSSLVETQHYDAVYRPAGFQLGTGLAPASVLSQIIGYDAASGRPSTLTTTPTGQSARAFTYSYAPGTDMLAGYTAPTSGGTYGIGYSYQPLAGQPVTNLRSSVKATYGSTVISQYDLTFNSRGQIESTRQSGTAFADYYTSSYSSVLSFFNYDSMGQLQKSGLYRGSTSATAPASADELPGHHFEFRYDSMGNRSSAGETGIVPPTTGGLDDSYTANSLNQYSSKTNYTARVIGNVAVNTSITVATANTLSTGKLDRAWAADLVPGQGTSSATGQATVYAAIPGGGTGGKDLVRIDNSKTWFLPPFTQTFTYDADGNMTGDQVWTYGYDAENRLISMTSLLPANLGFVRWNLTFQYDYLGRRVQKSTANQDNSGLNTSYRYVYNGWNLVAEYNATNSTLTRSYSWGLDLSGSFTATGGVGALLQITDHSGGKNYLPAYDHNGNVCALERDDGVLAAAYEYSGFGESMRADVYDLAVTNNPFKFSTRFTDVETGLVYYGKRYYNPILGRFINRDPIEEAGGINLYGFCGNNAVSRVDTLGMEVDPAHLPDMSPSAPDTPEKREAIAWLAALQNMLMGEFAYGHSDQGTHDLYGFDTAEGLMYSSRDGDNWLVPDGKPSYRDANGTLVSPTAGPEIFDQIRDERLAKDRLNSSVAAANAAGLHVETSRLNGKVDRFQIVDKEGHILYDLDLASDTSDPNSQGAQNTILTNQFALGGNSTTQTTSSPSNVVPGSAVRTVAVPAKSSWAGVYVAGVGFNIQVLDASGNPVPSGVSVTESVAVTASKYWISNPIQTGTSQTDSSGMVGDRWLASFWWSSGFVTVQQTIIVNGYAATWNGTLTASGGWNGDTSATFYPLPPRKG